MHSLSIPPAAQRDEKAINMLSAWIAENGLHCALNVGFWKDSGQDEPGAWGILLADVVRHLSNALQEEWDIPAEDTVTRITRAMLDELEDRTSTATGGFVPGHS